MIADPPSSEWPPPRPKKPLAADEAEAPAEATDTAAPGAKASAAAERGAAPLLGAGSVVPVSEGNRTPRLPASAPDAVDRRERAVVALVLTLLAVWLSICALQRHLPVNPASRFAAMEALVEHGTWAIEETSLVRYTVDKVQWEGHVYSSKPPLFNGLGAGVYALIRAMTGLDFRTDRYLAAGVVQIAMNVVPWIAALAALHGLLARLVRRSGDRIWAICAIALASLPTAYASHLNNHSASATMLFVTAALGAPMLLGPRTSRARAVATGLAGGFAAAFDLGAIPVVGLAGLVVVATLWRRGERGASLLFAAGGAFAPMLQGLLQWQMAGTPLPWYLLPQTYTYEGSYWNHPVEFDALDEAKGLYAFHCLFGHHGLFSVTPWLLLGLPWAFSREEDPRLEWMRRAIWGAVGFVVLYYIFRTTNYGGRCVGMRWMMVLVPPLAFAAFRWVEREDLLRRRPILVGLLTGWGAANALTGAINPWEEGLTHALFRALGMGSVPG